MTEAEWLASKDPEAILEFLRDRASERKLRLLAVACCRRIDHVLTRDALPDRQADARHAVALAERYADAEVTEEELSYAGWAADKCLRADSFQPFRDVAGASHELLQLPFRTRNELLNSERQRLTSPDDPDHLSEEAAAEVRAIAERERAAQAGLVRDIFGNPFCPVAFSPAWRTDTAVSLARGMYDGRDFSAMPILADALQDAGCDNHDILDTAATRRLLTSAGAGASIWCSARRRVGRTRAQLGEAHAGRAHAPPVGLPRRRRGPAHPTGFGGATPQAAAPYPVRGDR